MKVIVTDVNYRMSLAAIRDLGEAGYDVRAVHYGNGTLPPALKSRFLSGWERAKDLDGQDWGSETIAAADRIRGEEAAVLLPVGAKTIAALAASDMAARNGIMALLPTSGQLAMANDKAHVLRLAARLGIAVPRGYDSPDQAQDDLPAVIKYRSGEALGLKAPDRYRIVHTKNDLFEAYADMLNKAEAAGQGSPLIQRYVDGEGFGVSCLFDRESRPVSIVCHRRIREYPISGGPSSCCETAWNEKLVCDALALLKELRWTGIAMVEFRGSEENGYRLMEINPRIWGSFPLTRTAGTGFAEAYVRAAAGEKLPECAGPAYKAGKRMQFVFQDLASGFDWLKRGKASRFFAAVIDAANPAVRDGVIEMRDFRASMSYIGSAVKKAGVREGERR